MSEPGDRRLTITMVVLFGAMLLGVIALVVRAGLPKGEKIADIDLRAQDGAATIDAVGGDRLYFRTTVAMAPVPSKGAGYDAVRSSRLTLALVAPGGAPKTTECGVYNDEAMTVKNVESGMTISDAPIECSFTIATTGRYVVRPTVAWSQGASITAAKLEVRRERAN